MRTIIHRYVFREVLGPLALGLAVFTSVLLLARLLKLIELVVNRGLPAPQVAYLIGCLLPAMVEVAMPMALLLAVLIAFGRLSSDSEIVALRSTGVGLVALLPPIAVIAILATLTTLVVSTTARPWGTRAMRTLLWEVARVRASAGIKPRVFNEDFPGVVLYAESFDATTDRLQHVLIADERDPHEHNTVFASDGFMVSNPETHTVVLRLRNGWIHTREPSASGDYLTTFVNYDVNLNLRDVVSESPPTTAPHEMPLAALREAMRSGADVARRAAAVEWQRRLAIPFACPVLALIAIPLGIRPVRAVRSRGLAVSLVVVFGYYVLLSVGQGMAEQGQIPPAVGLWLPNATFAAIGGILFMRATQERPPASAPLAAAIGAWIGRWRARAEARVA